MNAQTRAERYEKQNEQRIAAQEQLSNAVTELREVIDEFCAAESRDHFVTIVTG
jgi:hypothetical protein